MKIWTNPFCTATEVVNRCVYDDKLFKYGKITHARDAVHSTIFRFPGLDNAIIFPEKFPSLSFFQLKGLCEKSLILWRQVVIDVDGGN